MTVTTCTACPGGIQRGSISANRRRAAPKTRQTLLLEAERISAAFRRVRALTT